jgi:Na+/melibiose symporter-like transporter
MHSGSTRASRGWYLLLLIPFVATLWVPFYNSIEPTLAGIPYFYWYQFLWVIISVVITAFVYFMTRESEVVDPEPRAPLNEDLA